jgi:hypothetical protein
MALETTKVLALKCDFTGSYWIDTSNNVEDCCLTGAVWSNECTYLALIDMKINFVKSDDTTELDGDVLEFEKFL